MVSRGAGAISHRNDITQKPYILTMWQFACTSTNEELAEARILLCKGMMLCKSRRRFIVAQQTNINAKSCWCPHFFVLSEMAKMLRELLTDHTQNKNNATVCDCETLNFCIFFSWWAYLTGLHLAILMRCVSLIAILYIFVPSAVTGNWPDYCKLSLFLVAKGNSLVWVVSWKRQFVFYSCFLCLSIKFYKSCSIIEGAVSFGKLYLLVFSYCF